MGLFGLFKKKDNVKKNNNVNIVFGEESFMHFLDMVIKFLDAYSAARPDEWYHLFISQEFEHVGNDTYGTLKFQIMLGSWYDGVLYQHPELEDYMKEIFVFDAHENEFIYTDFRTGRSRDCSFPADTVTAMLHSYLDKYEREHPSVKFERADWGAKISKNV